MICCHSAGLIALGAISMLTSLGVKSASRAAIRRSSWRKRCLRIFIRASLLVEIVDAAVQGVGQRRELGGDRETFAAFPFTNSLIAYTHEIRKPTLG